MKIAVVSGGFDPIHSGHIDYLKAAKEWDLFTHYKEQVFNNSEPNNNPWVIINSDNKIIEGATICKNGDLTKNYEYLRDYVNS